LVTSREGAGLGNECEFGYDPRGIAWLAEKGRSQEALTILRKIGGPANATRELEDIRRSLAGESGTLRELLEPGMRRAIFIGTGLALFNNWTGWTGIAFYLPVLFQKAGYSQASEAIWQNVLVVGGNVFLTLIAIWLVDRLGRRPLWLVTSLAMCFCLILAGFVFQLNVTGPAAVWVIFLCAAPHAIGLGPLPWLMMSEIYPTRIRARAVSVSTTFLWIAGFTGPLAFPSLEAVSEQWIGSNAGLFWFYAVICLLSFVWGWKFLPETNGRTLEEIAQSWSRH